MITRKLLVRNFSLLLMAMAAIVISSCSEDTGSIGVPPANETLESSTASYNVYSRSVQLDSIQARSAVSYLGAIYDPETNGLITSSFLSQFAIMEQQKAFPPMDSITTRDAQGNPCCDSVMLQLNFDAYYGDINAPLKLAIYPLDMNNPLSEDSTYYTTTDLRQYIRPGYEDKPIATKVFTAWDRIHGSDPSNSSASSYPSIRIPLPASEGNAIMNQYWQYLADNEGLDDNAHVNSNFDDSYHFIRNVLPGYYAEVSGGEGVMVRVFVDALYLFYDARAQVDSMVQVTPSYTVFAGTPEVIQSCQFSESNLDGLMADNTCTWLKSPVGIATELTLPIDEMFTSGHENDSISRVELMLTRLNSTGSSVQKDDSFDAPQKLLLVRKAQVNSFFSNNETPNSVTSFLATFSSTYNTYSFSNIGRLATYIHKERTNAVLKHIQEVLKVENPSESLIADETRRWTMENPDWNKCYVVPVETTTNTSTGVVTGVAHDLSISSARLVRGTEQNPIRLQVYYTRVAN